MAERTYPSVFVTGCARSGTTLMQVVLRAFEGMWGRYTEEKLSQVKLRSGLVVKKPFRSWDSIDDIPDALEMGFKVIVMFRDGRDVMTSRHPHPDYLGDYYVLDETRWVNAVECELPRIGGDVMAVRYEDLVTQFREQMQRVSEFIGVRVPDDDPMSETKKVPQDSTMWIAIRGQTELTRTRIGQWRGDKGRIKHLMENDRVRERFCRALVALGYEKDDGWLREVGLT